MFTKIYYIFYKELEEKSLQFPPNKEMINASGDRDANHLALTITHGVHVLSHCIPQTRTVCVS